MHRADDLYIIIWAVLVGATLTTLVVAYQLGRLGSRSTSSGQTKPSRESRPLPRLVLGAWMVLCALLWAIPAAAKWTPLRFHWWPIVVAVPVAATLIYIGSRIWIRTHRVHLAAGRPGPPASRVSEVMALLKQDAPEELAEHPDLAKTLAAAEDAWRAYNARLFRILTRLIRILKFLPWVLAAILMVASMAWGLTGHGINAIMASVFWPLGARILAEILYQATTEVILWGRWVRREELPGQVSWVVVLLGAASLLVDDALDVVFAILLGALLIALVTTLTMLITQLRVWDRRLVRRDEAKSALVWSWTRVYLAGSDRDLRHSEPAQYRAWRELRFLAAETAHFLPTALDSAEGRDGEYRKGVRTKARMIEHAIRTRQRCLELPTADELTQLRRWLSRGLLLASAHKWGELCLQGAAPEGRRWRPRSKRALLIAALTAAIAVGLAIVLLLTDGLAPPGQRTQTLVTLLIIAALSIANGSLGASTQGMQDLTMDLFNDGLDRDQHS